MGPEGHSKDFGFCLNELGAPQAVDPGCLNEPGVWVCSGKWSV